MDFERLTNEHKDAVYRQMIRVCGNREDAEDVLMEALLKAYRNLDQLRQSDAFRAWLAQIARRICWQFRQREAFRPLLQLSELEDEGRQVPSSEIAVDQRVAVQQMKEVVAAAIESLSPRDREVYELRDLRQMSGEEVAARLQITLPAMKSRLHRARRELRTRLDKALLGTEEKLWKSS
jgi:RNA polymerase sigma-70 factor, ECF subfamily